MLISQDVCEDVPEEVCETVMEKSCRTVQEEVETFDIKIEFGSTWDNIVLGVRRPRQP